MKETRPTTREVVTFSTNQPVYVKRNTPEGKVFDNVSWQVEGYRDGKVVVVSQDGRLEKELKPDTLHAWQEEMQRTSAAAEETIPRAQIMGESVRDNAETESPLRSEEMRREVGDTALDALAVEAAGDAAEEEEPSEAETIETDEFVQEANAVINGFIEQAQTSRRSLEGSMEALQTDRRRMRALLEEANQYASTLLNAVHSGDMGAVMQRITSIQDIAQQVRTALYQQDETRGDFVRGSRQLDDQSEQTIGELNASGYKFGTTVTEKMTKAQKDGQAIDRTAVENALGHAHGVAVTLRRLQTTAETMTMDVHRLENTNEGALQGFMRIITMSDEIVGQARYGRMDTGEVERLFRMVHQTAGEYDYEVGSAMAKLQTSLDDVVSTCNSIEPIH